MTRRHLFAAIVTLAWMPLTLQAGQKPDFSGTWVGVNPEAGGGEMTVTQTATMLTTRHGSSGDDHVASYKLDGTESRNVIHSHGEIVTISKAVWNGDRLVITESTTYPDGRKMERTVTWSLDSRGQLRIEVNPTAGPDRQTGVAVYRRKQ